VLTPLCPKQMLWNWYTVDACFISSSWHVTSSGMFAGSCIGVILLVMLLEFLRRSVKEFDRYIIRQHRAKVAASQGNTNVQGTAAETVEGGNCCGTNPPQITHKGSISSEPSAAPIDNSATKELLTSSAAPAPAAGCAVASPFRPSVAQQAIRALLHMLQFIVAYFVML
jgi:solute carrier family 31 (copper transporter), member 1